MEYSIVYFGESNKQHKIPRVDLDIDVIHDNILQVYRIAICIPIPLTQDSREFLEEIETRTEGMFISNMHIQTDTVEMYFKLAAIFLKIIEGAVYIDVESAYQYTERKENVIAKVKSKKVSKRRKVTHKNISK